MKKLLLVILITFCGISAKAQMLAVNTDMLLDVMMTPNAGVEVVVGERTTLGGHIFGNYKPWGKDVKMVGVQPEYRYFFSGRPLHKFFIFSDVFADIIFHILSTFRNVHRRRILIISIVIKKYSNSLLQK